MTHMQLADPAHVGERTVRKSTVPPSPPELRTTPLGIVRLCKNLGFTPQNAMRKCIQCIIQADTVYRRRGKNWYITSADCEFVVHADSGTIITAHRRPRCLPMQTNASQPCSALLSFKNPEQIIGRKRAFDLIFVRTQTCGSLVHSPQNRKNVFCSTLFRV